MSLFLAPAISASLGCEVTLFIHLACILTKSCMHSEYRHYSVVVKGASPLPLEVCCGSVNYRVHRVVDVSAWVPLNALAQLVGWQEVHRVSKVPVRTSNNIETTFNFVVKNCDNVEPVDCKILSFWQSRMLLRHCCRFWQQCPRNVRLRGSNIRHRWKNRSLVSFDNFA